MMIPSKLVLEPAGLTVKHRTETPGLYLSASCMIITFVRAKGCGCPAKASFTVVSHTRGSWSPWAVTMNWMGSDRLATSCSAYTVPSGLTLKLGSLLTKPTSLLRWQSSNFTVDMTEGRGDTELERNTLGFIPWSVRKSPHLRQS